MRRIPINTAAIVIAVLLQVTLINRLPLPRGAVPSLVLVLVAAMGAAGDGPLAGAVTGFLAGLALDVAPPGSQLTGAYALVYCLVGYACGWAGRQVEGQAVPVVLVAAAGAAAGEAATALLGVVVSDPEVTWIAVKHVVPLAVAYDILLTPFMLGLVSVLNPLRHSELSSAPSALNSSGARPMTRAEPKLRLAGAISPAIQLRVRRREPHLHLAGAVSPAIRPRVARREARLHLARNASPSGVRPRTQRREARVHFNGASSVTSRKPARQARTPRFSGRPNPLLALVLLLRPSPRLATPGRGWLNAGKPKARSASRHSPGRGWLASKPPWRMKRHRYASKNWVRSSKRRRALSRLGGWR